MSTTLKRKLSLNDDKTSSAPPKLKLNSKLNSLLMELTAAGPSLQNWERDLATLLQSAEVDSEEEAKTITCEHDDVREAVAVQARKDLSHVLERFDTVLTQIASVMREVTTLMTDRRRMIRENKKLELKCNKLENLIVTLCDPTRIVRMKE